MSSDIQLVESLDEGVDSVIHALFHQNDLDAAARLLDRVMAEYPEEAESDGRILELRGCVLFRQDQPELACDYLVRAVEMRPTDFGLLSNIGTIYNSMGRYEDAISYYHRALGQKYEVPLISLNLGNSYMALGRRMEALTAYRKAVAGDDSLTLAHKNIADILFDVGFFHEAEAAWCKVVQLMPKAGQPYYSLAVTKLRLFRDPVEAEQLLRKSIELGCTLPFVYTNLGIALLRQDRVDEALAASQQALELDPDSHQCYLNLSMIQLLLEDWENGWVSYEHRLHITPDSGVTVEVPNVQNVWDGVESLEGKTVFVRHEQGFGDTIHYMRFLQQLRGRGASRIILECLSELIPMFRFNGVADEYVQAADTDVSVVADFQVMLGSLMRLFDVRPDWTGPYLRADPELVGSWGQSLPPREKFRVGIVWQGSMRHIGDKMRSISLETFRPLSEVGVELIALQQGQGIQQVGKCEFPVLPLRQNRSWMETAALLPHMDLIISVDTSIVHVAGAMGLPCWVISAQPPDWRWGLNQQQSVWYPSVRIFRQHKYMDWGGVMGDVAGALRDHIR